MIVIRQQSSGSGTPDIYLGWLNWNGLSFLKPLFDPFLQQISPFTQQLSSMLLNTMPGASSMYTQINQIGDQLSSLNPFSQIMGSLGGGSSSGSGSSGGLGGLSSLFQGLQGRR